MRTFLEIYFAYNLLRAGYYWGNEGKYRWVNGQDTKITSKVIMVVTLLFCLLFDIIDFLRIDVPYWYKVWKMALRIYFNKNKSNPPMNSGVTEE